MNSDYWEARYAAGDTSGKGSRGRFALEKAALVNQCLARHQITSVLDIGCGDGYVARLFDVLDYLGVDPSPSAIRQARRRNPDKAFQLFDPAVSPRPAHLSLDVLHHLVDDADYVQHLSLLFTAERLVLVWVADYRNTPVAEHSRHRRWLKDVPAGWRPARRTPIKGAAVSFYVFTR